MSMRSNISLSCPELQLRRFGDEAFYSSLLEATQSLSPKDLTALEEELSYYTRTGLVGVVMSRLLAGLASKTLALAA